MFPDTMPALTAFSQSASGTGVPKTTIDLVLLRVSQVNGCGICVGMHAKDLRKAGESDERIDSVAAWRETRYFTDPERAALALAEAATRIADRPDPVPDEIWDAAAAHYTEEQLGTLVLTIAAINVWNRLNIATRQLAGTAA